MINFKQEELGRQLFDTLQARYPDLELVKITESMENPNHTWVNVVFPHDDERKGEIREVASEISMDLLLDYGSHITLSSAIPDLKP